MNELHENTQFAMSNNSRSPLDVSIVIPVYNEEAILAEAVHQLSRHYSEDGEWNARSYEILLCENGSSDATAQIARELMALYPTVKLVQCPEPNYGKALRLGIEQARGEVVICDEIDLCDTDFHRRALHLLEQGDCDFVVGSKALHRELDRRPLYRQIATRVLNGLFRVFLDFHGTDTHGLKAFRRQKLIDVVQQCVVDRDLFASEFVIRAERTKVQMVEIPFQVEEKRRTPIHLFRRVPQVLRGLGTLVWVIRLKG